MLELEPAWKLTLLLEEGHFYVVHLYFVFQNTE